MRFSLMPILLFAALPAWGGDALVEAARLTPTGDSWRVDVTLRHADTGWDHYADGWEVLDADGNRLGYRELLHPHVNEQPFTRSLGGVDIPEGTAKVFIRAHDSVHGWNEVLFEVAVP
ncbi:MAG: hypothetical protein ACWA47_12310 [Brevirhabdus sp.]